MIEFKKPQEEKYLEDMSRQELLEYLAELEEQLQELDARFAAFLDGALVTNPLKGEYFLPSVVSQLLTEEKASVRVLKSEDKWYGVTYAADKPMVVAALKAMTEEGKYPGGLWK